MRAERRRLSAVIIAGVALGGACTPGPTPPTPTTTTMPVSPTPQIVSFTASRPSGTAPLTTAFQWSLSGPAGATLTCSLDVEDDGIADTTATPCNNSSIRSATYSTAGSRTARLTVSDGTTAATATVGLNATAPSADVFAITVRFTGTPTPIQQAAFTDAANRWAEVIKTGLTDIPIDLAADECATGFPAFSGNVDDIVIDAQVTGIDGVGGILGQAGPCLIRTTGGLTIYGIMQFDSADMAGLESSGQLQPVILHEMGHVLGFGIRTGTGALWDPWLVGAGTGFPTFVGPVARGAWNAIGGSGDAVPVEGGGGPGTADSHWSEAFLGNELMTGYISGTSNPLSAITIGSLADLGYGVDLAAADPFGTPAIRAPGTATQLPVRLIHPTRSI